MQRQCTNKDPEKKAIIVVSPAHGRRRVVAGPLDAPADRLRCDVYIIATEREREL